MSGSSDCALKIPLKGALVFKCEPFAGVNDDLVWKCDSDYALPYKKRRDPRGPFRMTMKKSGNHLSVPVQIGKPRIKKAKTEGSLIKFMDNDDWRRKHEIDSNGWLKMSKAKWFDDGHEIKTNGKLKSSKISGAFVEHKIKFDGKILFSTKNAREVNFTQSESTADKRMAWAVSVLPTFELVDGVETTPWWNVEEENDKPL